MAHTNGMELFWSMLKRGHIGTFNHFNPERVGRQEPGFWSRHNMREQDFLDQVTETVDGMISKRLKDRVLAG